MHTVELIASILGVISVGLIVARNVLAFPIGIVMVALYVWIFFDARLYSDMLLQCAFVGLQIQGWYHWANSPKKQSDQRIEIRRLSGRQWWITLAILILGTLVLGGVMQRYTNAAIPFLDAGTTTTSLTAQWWMNNRYLDNWFLWIAVDTVYLYQYSSRELYFTTVLYAVFLGMAFYGWRVWVKAAGGW
jgi:nicotinamide mononucleotide transporter